MLSTKAESLIETRASGVKQRQQVAILNFLRDMNHSSFSRNQLSRNMGMLVGSVCARIDELLADGLIARGDPIKDSITGRTVQTVRAAPDLFLQ